MYHIATLRGTYTFQRTQRDLPAENGLGRSDVLIEFTFNVSLWQFFSLY